MDNNVTEVNFIEPDVIQDTPKKEINVYAILTTVAILILLGITVYVTWLGFSFYWDNMHSDIAGDLLFVREAVNQRSLFPSGWPHLQEMRFMHLTTVIIPFYLVTGDLNLSYPLAVAFMMILNMGMFYYMLSYRKRRWLPIIIGFTILLMLFSRYAMFSIFSMMFINGSLAVSLTTIFITVGAYMRIKYGGERRRIFTILLWAVSSIIAFMQGIQSNRLMIALYVPLLIVECFPLLLRILRDKEFDYKKVGKPALFAIVCMVCNMLGIGLIMMLIRDGVILVEYTLVTSGLSMMSHNHIWDQLSRLVPQLLSSLGLQGGVPVYSMAGIAYFARLAVVITLPILIYKTAAHQSDDKNIINIMLASFLTLMVTMIITHTGVGERFIFTITVVFAVMAVVFVDYLIETERRIITIVTCAIIFVAVLVSANTLNMQREEGLVQDRQAVADFIRSEGFTIGYGPFWHGTVLTAVGDFTFDVIYINATTFRARPHGVTMQRFRHDEERVFLVLTDAQTTAALNSDRTREILESGIRNDFPRGWVVWTFEHNPFR